MLTEASIYGDFFLIGAIVFSIYTLFSGSKVSYYGSSFFASCAFINLVIAFASSDFTLKNVFFNSSTIAPLIFRISGAWSSHEGSMLLWVTLLSAIGASFVKFYDIKYSERILSFIQLLFLLFVYFIANPFEPLGFQPQQGMGLNPMLQDSALSIHPPLLYLGYVCYLVPFTCAISMTLQSKVELEILAPIRQYSYLAMASLSAGIGLGSWWAYRELGWGGFWFFDPVENISLVAWILGIALHHTLLSSEEKGVNSSWLNFFALSNFLVILYGTFLVRSGILTSVHSFAFDEKRGLYLFLICTIITMLTALVLVFSRKPLYSTERKLILAGNIVWLASACSLLIAVTYPIYYKFYYNEEVVIDLEYFLKVFVPISLPALFLAGLAFYRKFTDTLLWILLALITMLYILNGAEYRYIHLIGLVFSIYLFMNTCLFAIRQKLNGRYLPVIIGHLAFALLIFSITLNSLCSKQVNFIGKKGGEVRENNMIVKLQNIKFSEDESYYRQMVEFLVEDPNKNIFVLKPENRLYKIEKALSQESDIFSFLFYDIYAVLSKIDGDVINAEIHYKPLMAIIWLSVFLISISFVILFIRRKA